MVNKVYEYKGTVYKTELGALAQDLVDCVLDQPNDADDLELTPDLVCAVNAMHAYAQRDAARKRLAASEQIVAAYAKMGGKRGN
jgi:hypothetical protein